jgi:hypothetical protein
MQLMAGPVCRALFKTRAFWLQRVLTAKGQGHREARLFTSGYEYCICASHLQWKLEKLGACLPGLRRWNYDGSKAVPVSVSSAAAFMMNPEIERNLGEQPIARIMREHNLKAHDLVATSPVGMTHKMVARACKGRRLTLNTQAKVLTALNRATGKNYPLHALFNY